MAITLRHRSASHELGNCWEWDSQRRVVVVVYRGVGTDIRVCSERYPSVHGYAIRRLSEDSFRIAPSQFDRRGTHWATHAQPFDGPVPAEFIELTNAPPHIAREMAELF